MHIRFLAKYLECIILCISSHRQYLPRASALCSKKQIYTQRLTSRILSLQWQQMGANFSVKHFKQTGHPSFSLKELSLILALQFLHWKCSGCHCFPNAFNICISNYLKFKWNIFFLNIFLKVNLILAASISYHARRRQ